MTLLRLRVGALLVLIVGFIAGAGCGSKGNKIPDNFVNVRGRVLKNGLPIQVNTAGLPPGDPGMQIVFIKLGTSDAGTEIPANILSVSDGTFELPGGIAPGRYRVTVMLAPVGSDDMFKGKYDKNNSKIELEIKGGEGEIVVDIDKYK